MPAIEEKIIMDETVQKQSQPRFRKSKMKASIINSPIYDEELMQRMYEGIIQKIRVEMDKEGLSLRGLSEISGVHFSHLSGLFSGRTKIGLDALIRISAAFEMSPAEFFPYDFNRRKTNGQRFDEITKELDISTSNFLLDQCVNFCREIKRIKRNNVVNKN